MKVHDTPLPDLFEIALCPHEDARGRFTRLFCEQELSAIRPGLHFTQINLSETRICGSVRGLHYQAPPAAEAKLIRCLRGRVFDVAVDIRTDSPTFLQWHAERLSADNGCALLIPPGFAHGFQALCDHAALLYCHSTAYAPTAEAGLHPLDPRLGIAWPLPVGSLSPRDAGQALLPDDFEGVRL